MTALPIGEYAAVTLLLFFGIKAIKDAWELPSNVPKTNDKSGPELDEYIEAAELVKEKVIFLKSFPLPRLYSCVNLCFFQFSIIYNVQASKRLTNL